MESLLILALVLFLAGPVLGIIALVKISDLNVRISKLKEELARLAGAGVQPAPVADKPVPAAPVAEATATASAKAWRGSEEKPEAAPDNWGAAAKATAKAAEETASESVAAPAPAAEVRNVEQALASRWLVWVGGVAIALGGLLFVKYAHDNGLIPPILRVIIGLLFGAGLVAGGEWVRRRDDAVAKGYVPAALSAAGLAICFGVIYAAYALYDILSPTACFPLLVLVGLAGLWLSLRQGPFLALLGLVGSYVAPALVPSEFPNVWGFFVYLLVILVAVLTLLRVRIWWWLGFLALAGSLIWPTLWLNGFFATDQIVPIALFALAVGAASVFLPAGRAILLPEMGSLADPGEMKPAMQLAVVGLAVAGVILAALVYRSGHDGRTLVAFAISMAAIVGFGWWRDGMVAAPLAAAAGSFIVLMAWKDVGFHEWAMDERGFWTTVPGLVEPPRFRNAMLAAMAAFTAVGIAGTWQRQEKRPWAALASGAGLLFLFGAWARADFTLSNTAWAVTGAVIAVVLATVADRVKESASRAAELLLVGTALLAVFAVDRLFDGVWMTLALAVLAALAAFATRRLPLPWLGAIAAALATFASARLFLGREFWSEPTDVPLGPHWVLYGYGVPAVLFWQASRWLKGEAFTKHRVGLEGLALGLAISLVSLELRVLIGGGITRENVGLLELAAHGLAWMGAAYGLAYRQQLFSSLVSQWGARILLVASCAMFFLALTVRNPVVTGDIVEGGRYINALWLAYLAPVPLLALMARKLDGLGLGEYRSGLGVFALVLLMAFVTLQVKRLFQDFTIDAAFLSDAESYAVSAAWVVTAIAIFVAGIRLDRQAIRYGGLAVLVLAVLKVFALDLFEIGGLWRIASIIGLGLCLIGVGWLYTRYVQENPKLENNP